MPVSMWTVPRRMGVRRAATNRAWSARILIAGKETDTTIPGARANAMTTTLGAGKLIGVPITEATNVIEMWITGAGKTTGVESSGGVAVAEAPA